MPSLPLLAPDQAAERLRALADAWTGTPISERSAFQTWLLAFCDALGVPGPNPPSPDYQFELPVRVINRDGTETTNFIDCWKGGHFALEAKATGVSAENDQPLRKAFGQVRNYASHAKGTLPPYLMVVDVPRTLMIWDRWSGEYGGFPAGRRIPLATLHERPDDIRFLQEIWTNPAARDPRGRAQQVSREIAAKLAELSAAFESRGHDPERVARFLMRCVFCFFAEDVELLPRGLFKKTLETARTAGGPDRVAEVLGSLWETMDQGGSFGADLIHRFNGHFFQTIEALPLTPDDVALLIDAAAFDWSRVEPSIFGTLLVRALDPAERHRLGAEYTPREYIERLVEPTVVEPLRERWTAVQAAVLQLTESEGKKPARVNKDREAAVKELLTFHAWLRKLRFLDPACGSGNFLYVTMAAVKRIELEVFAELERVRGREQKEAIVEEVHPRQFHGIEVKPWAREIAELTLWIGYHQFWREAHGGRTPPVPILEDTGTIECRDAVLAWDDIVHRPEKDRPDPTPRIVHPVTGELVPDPDAKLPYYEYVGARQAEWPEADFIVGNPPYIGNKRMREALGDGYVTALRKTYLSVPETADLVMYWWYRSGRLAANDAGFRAGLITTSSIRQISNRGVVQEFLNGGGEIVWALADHPWVAESSDDAAVRVSMTVLGHSAKGARIGMVGFGGERIMECNVTRIHSDLSVGADVSVTAQMALIANTGVVSRGYQLVGRGFVLGPAEANMLHADDPRFAVYIRVLIGGRDLTSRPKQRLVVDFGLIDETAARGAPLLFDLLRDRVKPERDANPRQSYREYWWRFGEPRPSLREFTRGLTRHIVTPQTARHRVFAWLGVDVAIDDSIIGIGLDDPFHLGVLSSTIHVHFAIAVGSRLGVGNDSRYNQSRCFAPFPFPDPAPDLRQRIGVVAERLDAHRKAAIARDERVTMTGMYNVVEKLRSGAALTPKERAVHEVAACGVLKDLHDELDALVATAYGWPWPMEREEILERLVALHAERVAEERAGKVRWLRPEYQIPRYAPEAAVQAEAELGDRAGASDDAAGIAPDAPAPWPGTAVEQLGAVKAVANRVGPTAAAVSAAFAGADQALVRRHLETLVVMGEV
ncbi:MAG: type IIL restriction-modification enzyme MmeI [Gemmatimonadales bacterium]|nr:type IIL restriction-modification enzyme MmeI [Gemmatimonadales bacterium]MDZ4388803.1 type IIL restriction-modification enzyme MmeI [Gemmatimonadales bacterium]